MWDLAAPMALVLLPLPVIAAWLLPRVSPSGGALRVPASIAAKLMAESGSRVAATARSILPWLIWVGIVGALTDPRIALSVPALPASGRDIMLALDLSGSMSLRDFVIDGKPAQRIDALKRVAKEFIQRRAGDRIGLVVFASEAYVAVPPTFDLPAVSQALDEVSIGLVGRQTAIGDGLGLALKRLSQSDLPGRVVILLSDGQNNAGSASPLSVAILARKLGIRVHTIALGLHDLKNPQGDPDPVDTETLKAVADASCVPCAFDRRVGGRKPFYRPARARSRDHTADHYSQGSLVLSGRSGFFPRLRIADPR
jgi:Ca-activated chloride channel family protein